MPANCFFSASTRLERASSSQFSECTNRTAGTRLRAADRAHAVGNLHRVHVLRAHEDRVGVRGVLGDVVDLRRKALQADRGDLIEDQDFEFFCGHWRIINYACFLFLTYCVRPAQTRQTRGTWRHTARRTTRPPYS